MGEVVRHRITPTGRHRPMPKKAEGGVSRDSIGHKKEEIKSQ